MDEANKPETPNIQADNKSVAVGGITAGGNIGDINIHAGDTKVYQYASEDEVPLTSAELENGLKCFATFLPERAPVLQERFSTIAKRLRATLGTEINDLSPILKRQRQDAVDEMKLMCLEVLDVSFRALCTGENPPPYDSRPPFLGLFAFRPEDREFYFGREALIQKLVTRIQEHPFLAVMGASGSGKSSLVMAGLIPALEAKMVYLTPTSTPRSQLQAAQAQIEWDTVLVVDQFEELFTLTRDTNERQQFVDALLKFTETNRVVVTMRADFWGEVAIYKHLTQSMQEHQELIAPMDTSELRSAVGQQAAAVGLRFDPTLIESILDEVEGEPGAMPLLQHALWMLWKRRHGLWLKADEYRAFGGVRQAIASTAEEVYASCPDLEQELLRNIFLRLTRLDESGEGRDTRRRVSIGELLPAGEDSGATVNLLNKLADARLIVKTDKEAEVAHEALIRHWSRLTHWLNEDRNNLHLLEGLSEDAREWDRSNRDDSLLNHRGGRLELAVAIGQNPRYQLNPTELAYLNACVEVRERARIEKEQQQQRELDAAKALAEASKRLAETAQAQLKAERRARLLTTVMLIIMLVLAYNPVKAAALRQVARGALIKFPQSYADLGDKNWNNNDAALYFYPSRQYSLAAFAIESEPVSNQRYQLCVQAKICTPPAGSKAYQNQENQNRPVLNVTSVQAALFCKWLGRRLPTDKEWEYAARNNSLGATEIYEWTSTSFEYDWQHPEQTAEWTDFSIDPPERLTIRGGGSQVEQQTIRIGQGAYYADSTTGFRCAMTR